MNIKSVLLVCGITASSLGKYQHAAFAATAPDSSSPSKESYIVMMKDEPILTHDIDTTQSNQERKLKRKSANSNGKNKKYKKYLKNKHAKTAKAVGVSNRDMTHEYYHCSNGFQAFMTSEQAAEMRNREDVAQVVKDQMIRMDDVMPNSGGSRRLSEISLASDIPITPSMWSSQGRPPKSRDLTITSPEFLGLNDKGGPWERGIDGEGVVIGVIDSGIWPEHPSFADDGTYPSLDGFVPNSDSLPCEFGNTAHNPDDSPFTCNNKLLGARIVMDAFREQTGFGPDRFDSARDDAGHGTHVASTAAGNKDVTAKINGVNLGEISGMAPRARIIAYKAIEAPPQGAKVADLMKAIDYACQDNVDVINYSVQGPSDGLTSIKDIAFLNAARAGILVATAAGNDGPSPSTTFKSSPWYTVVAASSQEADKFQGSVSSSDGDWRFFGASYIAGTDTELPLVDGEDAGSELCLQGELDEKVVEGNIVLCKREGARLLDKSRAVFDAGGKGMILYPVFAYPLPHSVPSVHINNNNGLTIKEYIKAAGPKAVARITVLLPDKDAPVIAEFSSRGPNMQVPDIIRPDITAPGVSILAGWSPKSVVELPAPRLFALESGTSMASPHIAGIFALISQAHPDWSPAMAKSALMTTSYQNVSKIEEDGRLVQAEPFDMGAGHVNVGKINKGSFLQPGLVYDAGYDDYIAFLCDELPPEILSNLYNPNITCEELESQGYSLEATDLNYPSIGISSFAGTKTVTRKVTSVAKEKGYLEYKAVVASPKGYEVVVNPGTIRLKRGETVSFEVTATNVDSPLDVWGFGSVTWVEKTGKYKVYSPIAVKSILFDYPSDIIGSGDADTSSFDVSFGYTGGYQAKSYGLPATIRSGTVQEILLGYSNAALESFDIPSGAKKFDFAIPSVAIGNSITILLFKPNTQSPFFRRTFSVGLEKAIIFFSSPEEGQWNMIIQSEQSNASYDLYSWILGPDGGTLSVVNAPEAALTDQKETIEYMWEEVLSNEWYYGFITHIGNDGTQLGITTVVIDNRNTAETIFK